MCYGNGAACDVSQRTLIVLVHGYGGNPRKTWTREQIGGIAEWVLDTAKLDADTLSFGFQTSPWRRANIVTAAEELGRVLSHEDLKGRCYGHYVFLTHSTGGLVVKYLLNQGIRNGLPHPPALDPAAESPPALGGPDRPPELQAVEVAAVATRTRAVVNFAVPHAGASPFVSSVLFFAGVVNVVYTAGVKAMALITGGAPSRGFNKMVWQLMYRNPWVLLLEREHVHLLNRARDALHPRPATVDILADSDPVIARYERMAGGRLSGKKGVVVLEGYSTYTTRGTHAAIKLPLKRTDLVVSEVAQVVKHLRPSPALTLATVTYTRIVDLDTREELDVLFDDTARADRAAGPLAGGSQEFVYQELVAEVGNVGRATGERDQARWFVVAGDAGVGKTVALRRVARRFAADFPGTPARGSPPVLPILIPLQQISKNDLRDLRPDPRPGRPDRVTVESLWDALVVYWCGWMNDDLIPKYMSCDACLGSSDPAIRPDPKWVDRQLRKEQTVLILDAVDEFLMVDRRFLTSDIRELVDHVRQRYRGNARLTIVLGVRSSQPNLMSLTDGATRTFEIRPISEDLAKDMFRGACELLARLTEDSKKLLLTPLVLSQLGPRMQTLNDARLASRAGILRAALEEILRKSFGREAGYQAAPWVDALTAVGWLFFKDDKGQMAVVDLAVRTAELQSDWGGAGSAVAEGAAAFADPGRRQALLDRTVFLPTALAAYRFRHREWIDFLVGLYVAQCVRAKRFIDFGARIFNKDIYLVAGEELDRDDPRAMVTRHDVDVVDRTPHPMRRVCALSNLLATMGNSHIDIEPRADEATPGAMERIGALLKDPKTPVLPAVLGVNTFCVRALRNRCDDNSRRYIRREL